MEIKLWENFSKRKNSTKQPSQDSAIIKDVRLKESTSLDNPTFLLSGNINNYTYVQSGFVFYFVNEIVSITNDIFELRCEKDCLATYKSYISSSRQFISRSASDYNVELPDNIFTPQANISTNQYTTNVPFINSTGAYIARIITNNGITNYCDTKASIDSVVGHCFNNDLFDESFIEEVGKTLFNYKQFLVEVYWIPANLATIKSGDLLVFLGKYQVQGTTSGRLVVNGLTSDFNLNTPSRYYNDYRDYDSRFTEFILDLPGIGTTTLSPNDVYNGISIKSTMDCITGAVKYEFYSGGSIITEFRSNYKVPIQISGTTSDQLLSGTMHMASGAASTMLGAYSLNAGEIAQGLYSMAEGAIEAEKQTAHILGTQGSIIDLANDPDIHLTRIIHECSGSPVENLGRKLNEYRTINSLSGFTQCMSASIDIPSESGDKDIVNNYLNSGFYYE